MATSMAAVCPGCFRHKGGEIAVCPGCGYDAAASRSPLLLPVLTRLNQRYLVGQTLGKPGGFGVTYLGFDVTLRVSVAIKEYCPRELVGRDASRKTLAPHSQEDGEMFRFGLQAFLDEARTLAKFDHANVVRVRDFFEANGTAYLVMDYYEGESLLEYLARHGGILPWRATLELMLPVLDGLREVHRHGFLHRDIKPHNIYLTTQGRPILLDFGSARQAMGERSRSLSVVLTEGYAPFEQYHSRGQQGPWTDIYGAAATIYLLLTGQTPPPAPERIRGDGLIPPRQLVPDLPPPLNAALMSALAMDALQRPQTMEQFEEWLHGVAEGKAPVESQSLVKLIPKVIAEFKLIQLACGQRKGLMTLAAVIGLIGAIFLVSHINLMQELVKNFSQELIPTSNQKIVKSPTQSHRIQVPQEVKPQEPVVTSDQSSLSETLPIFPTNQAEPILPQKPVLPTVTIPTKVSPEQLPLNTNLPDQLIYSNGRFGFSLKYPPAVLFPQGESDNGDGQNFYSHLFGKNPRLQAGKTSVLAHVKIPACFNIGPP